MMSVRKKHVFRIQYNRIVYFSVANPDPELLFRIRIQQKIKEQLQNIKKKKILGL